MKRCPFCAEEIQDAAVVCRFCGRDVSPAPAAAETASPPPLAAPLPPSVAPARAASFSIAKGNGLKAGLALLGVGFVLGCIGWHGVAFLTFLAGSIVLLRGPAKMRALASVVAAMMLLIPGALVSRAFTDMRNESAQKASRAAALARVPGLATEMEARIAESRWQEAANLHAQIKVLDPSHPSLASAWAKIGPEISKVQAAQREAERRRSVAAGVAAARKVVADSTACDTPNAIAEAWKGLRQVQKEDPEWSTAVRLAGGLERCRTQVERSISKGHRAIMTEQRAQMAKKLETTMLDQGMNVDVKLSGSSKDRLTIEWALMSKAAVHKLTDGGAMREGSFLSNMQRAGFRRVSFANGLPIGEFGVYYDLEPPSEAEGGKAVLAQVGLAAPLALK